MPAPAVRRRPGAARGQPTRSTRSRSCKLAYQGLRDRRRRSAAADAVGLSLAATQRTATIPTTRAQAARRGDRRRHASISTRTYTLYALSTPRPYLPQPERVARFIQSALAQVGHHAPSWCCSRSSAPQRATPSPASHDLALFGWIGDTGDPDNFLYVLFHSDNAVRRAAQNIAFYRDAARRPAAARGAGRRAIAAPRERLYAGSRTGIAADAPWVPLAHSEVGVAARAELDGHRGHRSATRSTPAGPRVKPVTPSGPRALGWRRSVARRGLAGAAASDCGCACAPSWRVAGGRGAVAGADRRVARDARDPAATSRAACATTPIASSTVGLNLVLRSVERLGDEACSCSDRRAGGGDRRAARRRSARCSPGRRRTLPSARLQVRCATAGRCVAGARRRRARFAELGGRRSGAGGRGGAGAGRARVTLERRRRAWSCARCRRSSTPRSRSRACSCCRRAARRRLRRRHQGRARRRRPDRRASGACTATVPSRRLGRRLAAVAGADLGAARRCAPRHAAASTSLDVAGREHAVAWTALADDRGSRGRRDRRGGRSRPLARDPAARVPLARRSAPRWRSCSRWCSPRSGRAGSAQPIAQLHRGAIAVVARRSRAPDRHRRAATSSAISRRRSTR